MVVDGEEEEAKLWQYPLTGESRATRYSCRLWVSGISDQSTLSSFRLIVHLFRYPRKLWMSQQPTASKPSLQGVKIKARKGAVKAQAKHEPSGTPSHPQTYPHSPPTPVFRDQLYKHLETVPENDFDTFTTKFIQAGSTLEFLKYADTLFEIILVGGLIQPGGSYIDDGAPTSPFTVFNAKDPASVEDLKKYVEVLNKLIRRYTCAVFPTLPTLHSS